MPLPPASESRGPSYFQRIVVRGRLPNATVPFPRVDDLGQPICQVYMRPLTQREMDVCRANAAAYVARLLKSGEEMKWRPEELEDNATAAEILAIACRQDDDPEKPIFELGVLETRECTTEELAMLFTDYNRIREKSYPTLNEMSEQEMWAFVRALEEGARQDPFSRASRSHVEAFARWAAMSLVSLSHLLTGTISSDSPPLPSGESPAT